MHQISTGSTTQITTNTYTDMLPQIDGDYVSWHSSETDWEVFLYQISTGITTQVTDNTDNDSRPRIDGNYLVWSSPTSVGDIYLYQISTGTTTVISQNPGYDDVWPQITGDYVAWMGYDSVDADIYLYQISTNTLIGNITNDDNFDALPIIDGNYVTWTQFDGSDQEIMLYHICNNIPLVASAALNGDDLAITITAGDGPFDITGTGPGLPLLGVDLGTFTLPGPGDWTGVTVTETAGDGESILLGDFRRAASPPATGSSATDESDPLDDVTSLPSTGYAPR